MALKLVALVLFVAVSSAYAKVYDRCDLARELVNQHGFPQNTVSTWICIVQHESSYNTAAEGHLNTDGSVDHGLFQINDRYWCSPGGNGCNVACSALQDDNISDDCACAQLIYNQSGFGAWTTYQYCSGDTSSYTQGCF